VPWPGAPVWRRPGSTRAGAVAGTGSLPPPRRGRGGRGRSPPGRLPGAQVGGRCVAGETDVDPAGVLLGARSWGMPVPGALIRARTRPCRRQKSASPASGRRAISMAGRPARMASSRTGAPSSADTSGLGIRPPARSAGDAGREEAPRGWLEGAGLEPRGGGGAHGLADMVAADRGGQGDPADGGGAVLPAGHRPADPDGLFYQGPGVRAAFGLVAVQQVRPGPAGQHVGELPGQVVGVAQPGGQALAK
jgi:hypothetical protein